MDKLTPLEKRLVEHAAAGEELDCAPTGVTETELDQIDDWGNRKIRAEVLVALCTGEAPDWSVHPRRGLRLRGAFVAGQVDLSRAQMAECPMAFHTCRFEEAVVLYQATTSDMSFESCAMLSLIGDEFTSTASLYLAESHLRQMSFEYADFRGSVELSNVHLINPDGIALGASGMNVSDVRIIGARVEGEAILSGADIRGSFSCINGTELVNPGGIALDAAGVSASSILLNDVRIEGEAALSGAEIKGSFSCGRDTELINPGGIALDADGISASDVLLKGIRVEGEAVLTSADVRREFRCGRGTELINPGGYALNAGSCQVGDVLLFPSRESSVGWVNLAYAQIGTLSDDLSSWPDTYNLVGFTYNSLGSDQDLNRRLEWINKSTPFSPHVYTQLADVYRRSGQETLARQVAIRREKERGRQPDLSWEGRAWNRFLGLTVAYGYQPWRAVVPLVALFLLGWYLFALPPAQDIMVHSSPKTKEPTTAATCHEFYPCFSPPVYVVDTLLPIIDLHQETNWTPARVRPWGIWYEIFTYVLIASGWILTTAVVAGIGSLWRRE